MRTLGLVALIAFLCGCVTTRGPDLILDANGLPVSKANEGLAFKFMTSYNKAVDASGGDPSAQEVSTMFEDGTTLVYAHCSSFFATAGRTQTRLMVWKDAIATFGTLAAGIVALDGGGTGDLDRLAVVSLGSSTALSGIDVYTQHYLFGAENVDAVRELTLNALSAHSSKVKEDPPKSYQGAIRHLLDNQALCLTPRIAMMAREAIKNGAVVAYQSGQKPSPALAATADQIIFKELGTKLNPPSALSVEQVAGYYWLLVLSPTSKDKDEIYKLLEEIPESTNPYEKKQSETDTAKLKESVPNQGFVEDRLARLSAETLVVLTEVIASKTTVRKFAPPATPTQFDSGRVKVEVR